MNITRENQSFEPSNERDARIVMEPAGDSELQRWIDACDGDLDTRGEHEGRACGWCVLLVVAAVVYGGVWLLVL